MNEYVRSLKYPILIEFNTWLNLMSYIADNTLLKMVYGDILVKKLVSRQLIKKGTKQYMCLQNDEQTRAIIEIMQQKKVLTKNKKVVQISSK